MTWPSAQARLRAVLRSRLWRWTGTEELEKNTRSAFRSHQEELFALRAAIDHHVAESGHRLGVLEAQSQVAAVMAWVQRAQLAQTPLISVIMPTRDRAERLSRAIESVRAQTYENWELVLVDDGSVDATAEIIGALEDDRIRGLRLDGVGVTRARNAALDVAEGEVIAYLDDDNVMHAEWLRTVAWAFETNPEADVVYGAFIVDNYSRVTKMGAEILPQLVFRPFDRARLPSENPADMSVLAHRAGLAEARFNERLRMYGDWELFARLVRHRVPFAVPAIAAFYTSDVHPRISDGPIPLVDREAVMRACGIAVD